MTAPLYIDPWGRAIPAGFVFLPGLHADELDGLPVPWAAPRSQEEGLFIPLRYAALLTVAARVITASTRATSTGSQADKLRCVCASTARIPLARSTLLLTLGGVDAVVPVWLALGVRGEVSV